MLCHTFPQERPTGRSGTASAGSGKSADAEDPSFSRQISWRLGRLFTAGAGPILPTDRWFVYQTQDPRCGGPDEWIVRERDSDEAANRSSVRCYTARLVCEEAHRGDPSRLRSVAHGSSGDMLLTCSNDQ
jgi:hypothetical protein